MCAQCFIASKLGKTRFAISFFLCRRRSTIHPQKLAHSLLWFQVRCALCSEIRRKTWEFTLKDYTEEDIAWVEKWNEQEKM